MSKIVFVYIWEYLVKEEHLEEFKRIYGTMLGMKESDEANNR